MQNAADHTPVIDAFLTSHVPWQMRLDPTPLLVTEPKQITSHLPAPESSKQGISNQFTHQDFY
jgi:hypothetical protein